MEPRRQENVAANVEKEVVVMEMNAEILVIMQKKTELNTVICALINALTVIIITHVIVSDSVIFATAQSKATKNASRACPAIGL